MGRWYLCQLRRRNQLNIVPSQPSPDPIPLPHSNKNKTAPSAIAAGRFFPLNSGLFPIFIRNFELILK